MPVVAPDTRVTSRLHAASPVCKSLLSGRNIHIYCIGLPVCFQVFRCKNCKLPVGTAAMDYAGSVAARGSRLTAAPSPARSTSSADLQGVSADSL